MNLQGHSSAGSTLWDSERVQTAIAAFAHAVGRDTPPGFKYSSFGEMKELHAVRVRPDFLPPLTLMKAFKIAKAESNFLLQAFVLRLSQLLPQLHADSSAGPQAELEDYIV